MLCFFRYVVIIFAFFFGAAANAQAVELPDSIASDGSLVTKDELPWKIYADSLVSVND